MLPSFPKPRKATPFKDQLTECAAQLKAQSGDGQFADHTMNKQPPAQRNRSMEVDFSGLKTDEFPPIQQTLKHLKSTTQKNHWHDRAPRNETVANEESLTSAETEMMTNAGAR